MAVKIRLALTGRKHQISYRIVAQDSRAKRDGRFLEILGYYNPKLKAPRTINIKEERLNFWISKGAQPTAAVSRLINNEVLVAKGLTTNAKTAKNLSISQ